MAADCVQRQAESLAGFLGLGPVVVMPSSLRVWRLGLKCVSTSVDEQAEGVCRNTGRGFQTKVRHLSSVKPDCRGQPLRLVEPNGENGSVVSQRSYVKV